MAWQDSLFAAEPPADRALSFTGLRRDQLDGSCWLDVVSGWVPDHAALFDWLLEHAPWRQRTRRMWDADVLEPRLVAAWETGAPLPEPVAELVRPLDQRYGVRFDSCLVNLYRDGQDAVAWHGDTVRKRMRDPLVATVSLGARRPFLLRPVAGGPVAGGPEAGGPVARRYRPGEGDLLVMGGSCQHDWVHTVPRDPTASGARMSVTLRHSRPGLHPGDARLRPGPRAGRA